MGLAIWLAYVSIRDAVEMSSHPLYPELVSIYDNCSRPVTAWYSQFKKRVQISGRIVAICTYILHIHVPT